MNMKTWSKEEEILLVDMYVNKQVPVAEIAEHFERNTRSITTKLVKLKVYVKPSAVKPDRRSVKTMVYDLEKMLEITIDGYNLSKKSNLEVLVDAIKLKLDSATK